MKDTSYTYQGLMILVLSLSFFFPKVQFISSSYKIKSTKNNNKTLNIADLIISQNGSNFDLGKLKEDECIDRMRYEDQLLKFFDFINFGLEKETIIIFGSMTGIGKWFINYYSKSEKYSILLIKGIFDFDFQNPVTTKLLGKLRIKRMIICYAPDFESFQTIQSMKNMNNKVFSAIANTVEKFSIDTCFFSFPPFFEEKYMHFKTTTVKIFLLPYIVTNEEISLTNFLDQKILRVHLNNTNYKTKFGEYDDYYILKGIYDSIIPNLIEYKTDKKFVVIESKNMIKLSNFLGLKVVYLNKYNFKFVDELKNSAKFEIIAKDNQILKFDDAFVHNMMIYKQYISDYCYVDFNIVTRNDNYGDDMFHRIGIFIQSINDGLGMFPSAKAGLHIADYNSPGNNYLYNDLGLPLKVLNITRTTIISQQQHKLINDNIGGNMIMYEYIAKNIAMRYSKATYILHTNMDDIFVPLMFEAIALQHFSPKYLYKARRINLEKIINYRTIEYEQNFNKVDDDFIKFNKIQYNLFEDPPLMSPGDFQMASKEYFDLIHGYSEYPQNVGMDDLIIWATHRFITLGVEFNTGINFIHQNHKRPSKKDELFYKTLGTQLKCKGFANVYNFTKYNKPNWGYKDLEFQHIKLVDMLK